MLKNRSTHIIWLFLLLSHFAFSQKTTSNDLNLIIAISDERNNQPIRSTIEIKDLSEEKSFFGKGNTDQNGKFHFTITATSYLQIKVQSEGYMPTTLKINPQETALDANFNIDIKLTKIEVGTLIKLENVKFHRGEYNLLPESFDVLDDLISLLHQNPKMIIELGGHTDAVGGIKSNLKLSENRVLSVKNYLTQAHIKPNRIKAVGYGGKKPVAKNNTEEGREKNRRVEFKVLKIN